MRIALVETTPKPKVYPVALLKIGSWLRDNDHECTLYRNCLPRAGEADEIWLNTIFTFHMGHALQMTGQAQELAPVVRVGGIASSLFPDRFRAIGADVHMGLIDDAERYFPDYSLLNSPPEYSIAYTSRGCTRKCKFCMVSKLEPIFKSVVGWEEGLHPGTTKVQFFDNNWLAKDEKEWLVDVELMKRLVKEKRLTEVEFNQGLDARLMTDEKADALVGIPLRPIRFAFDGMHEDGHYQGAIRKMVTRGFRNFRSYVLYNFTDKPQDFYYRIREGAQLGLELRVECKTFPMRYQPITEADEGRSYIGKHWTKRRRDGVHHILAALAGPSHMVAPRSMEEFDFWFGRNSEEFVQMLDYPRLKELVRRKQGAVRLSRKTIAHGERSESFWKDLQ